MKRMPRQREIMKYSGPGLFRDNEMETSMKSLEEIVVSG